MAVTGDNPLLRIHSIMETPVLDERKWAKVPDQATDAVLVDMEDTVAQARKEEGRAAVVAALRTPEFFGGRTILTRPNALDTPWGHDDTVALARAGAQYVLLPMITSADDVLAFQRIFREHGADPYLVPTIETPAGVGAVEAVVAVDRVAGLAFGEGDLTAAMGAPIYEPDGSLNPILPPARSRVYLAASAANCAMFDIAMTRDIKDLVELRRRAEQFVRMGATGMFALYPPHVALINEVFAPDADAVGYARTIVEAFEGAAGRGEPAVQLASGKPVLIHDYKKAVRVLSRAGERVG